MELNYEFDVFRVIPDAIYADPKLGGMFTDLGLAQNMRANHVFLFRNQATADALRTAPPELREPLKALGFGLNVWSSGCPDGFYPASDGPARADLMERFDAALKEDKFSVICAPNGFELAGIIKTLGLAMPMQVPSVGIAVPAPTAHGRSRGGEGRPKIQVTQMAVAAAIALLAAWTFGWLPGPELGTAMVSQLAGAL